MERGEGAGQHMHKKKNWINERVLEDISKTNLEIFTWGENSPKSYF